MLETTIIGNVGSLRFAQAGKTPVLNLSIAASRKLGDREFTDWISAKIWGDRAQKLQEHVQKGMKLLLRGRPEAKGYQRPDGTIAAELILHVNDLEFLSPKTKQPKQEVETTLELNGERPKRKRAA